jgi:ABC-type polysaccharide/polyol phosphate export permease
MMNRLREIADYRDLLLNLITTELKLRYRESVLGFLWTIINPLFFLLILVVVFAAIMKIQIPHYAIFLLTGLTSWSMLQQTVVMATTAIWANQGILKKIRLPKIIFPLANVLARYVDHLILTLILLVVMAFTGMPVTWSLLFIPPLIAAHFIFSLGLSLMASVIYIKIKDIQHIIAILFQALFYITPIIYSPAQLPPGLRPLFIWNPLYYFIQCFRFPIYYGSLPPKHDFFIMCGLTVSAFVLGLVMFYGKEKDFVFYFS